MAGRMKLAAEEIDLLNSEGTEDGAFKKQESQSLGFKENFILVLQQGQG